MRSFPWDSIIIGKNEEYGYPIIDRPSSAKDLRELYKTFFTNGVFLNEEDAFQVTPGDGMNIIVAGGKCGIEGTIGYEAAPRGLAIQASSTTADRIDTVVLRWNNNVEVRNIDLYVKTGVAQSVPVRPTLTRSESVWELGIADIFVAKNSGAISTARITDTRLQTNRCGAVTPFAKVDTTGFFDQLQEQTQIAVDLAQSAIDETLAGNLQSQIDSNGEDIAELDGKAVKKGAMTKNASISTGANANQLLQVSASNDTQSYIFAMNENTMFVYDNNKNKTVHGLRWGDDKASVLAVDHYKQTTGNVAAGNYATVNIAIDPREGYTPIGIVGVWSSEPQWFVPTQYNISGNNVVLSFKNTYTSTLAAAAFCKVMYAKIL